MGMDLPVVCEWVPIMRTHCSHALHRVHSLSCPCVCPTALLGMCEAAQHLFEGFELWSPLEDYLTWSRVDRVPATFVSSQIPPSLCACHFCFLPNPQGAIMQLRCCTPRRVRHSTCVQHRQSSPPSVWGRTASSLLIFSGQVRLEDTPLDFDGAAAVQNSRSQKLLVIVLMRILLQHP